MRDIETGRVTPRESNGSFIVNVQKHTSFLGQLALALLASVCKAISLRGTR